MPDLKASAVYQVCKITPLSKAIKQSLASSNNVYLKREDLQPVNSFKLRGAYNKIVSLNDKQKAAGIIAASAGNHAQGVALSAKKLGLSALIVMPKTTPQIKVEAVKSYGAEVVLVGDNYSEASEACYKLVGETGRTFIHPFDDPLVIAGQGTIGQEIIDQLPEVDYVFVPVGGGGLLAGVAEVIKRLKPDVKIIGVEPEDSNAMQASIAASKRVILDHVGIFADGVAVKQVGEQTFKLTRKYVDEIITVSVDEICAAIKNVFEDTRSIVEPAGALSVAGANKYLETHKITDKNIVCILSGANMTFERLQFIAERTLIGSGKEALLSIQLPETPGALRKLCLEVVNGYSISEFSYRYTSDKSAVIFIGFNLSSPEDKQQIFKSLEKYNYTYQDLTLDDIAKEHTRHMIGGKLSNAFEEVILEINFPERPGALLDFLNTTSSRWSISLFHYRGLGSDNGRVLIGFKCDNWLELEKSIKTTGYDYQKVDSASLNAFIV